MTSKLTTEFLPAERATAEALKRHIQLFADEQQYERLGNTLPILFMILNGQRQVVYVNKRVMDGLGVKDTTAIYGLRPGELFRCVHASESAGGCGTTRYCELCGAAQAIAGAQQGVQTTRECRLAIEGSLAADYRVMATPLEMGSEQFTVFTLQDIQDEKRRKALESVFYHDILNTASGLTGLLEVLEYADSTEERDELLALTRRASQRLIEEISSSRALAQAEEDNLTLDMQRWNLRALLSETVDFYSNTGDYGNTALSLEGPPGGLMLETDRALLMRSVGNLVKNALEAAKGEGTVRVKYWHSGGLVGISVHNHAVMPRAVRDQVFSRSFSTKGKGRGLGTYSVKLFVEKYLGGKVWFESVEGEGTTFHIAFEVGDADVSAGAKVSV